MVTCSFLSQSPVYDQDIKERLDDAISGIIQKADAIRFLFYEPNASSSYFFDLFAVTAYRAKLLNPDKSITLSLGVSEEQAKKVQAALQKWQYTLPSFMVDEILPFPMPEGVSDRRARSKQIQKRIVEQSDYIFTYLYDCLYDTNILIRDYAVKKGKAITDLTVPATCSLIREKYAILPERQRTAMELWLEGKTAMEIAHMLGIGKSRPHQLIAEGSRAIRENLRSREYRPAEAACTIFHLGPASYDTLTAFDKTVEYLIREENVRNFFVDPQFQTSTFWFALKKHTVASRIQAACLGSYPTSDADSFDLETMSTSEIASRLLNEDALAQVITPYSICDLRFCPPELIKQRQERIVAGDKQMPLLCDLGKPIPEIIVN